METQGNGKQPNGNGKPLDAIMTLTGEGDASKLASGKTLATENGTITATPGGAAAVMLGERHEFTVEDRKAMAVKVATKAMLDVTREQLRQAGFLPSASKK